MCEVYKLYRETFHLTVNYIDRYLSNTEDVYKGRLQLIGKKIEFLFIFPTKNIVLVSRAF